MSLDRITRGLLAAGTAGLVLGHGAQAAVGNPLWTARFVGALRCPAGITLDPATAHRCVQFIGWADLLFGLALMALLAGALRSHGLLHRCAHGTAAIAIYSAVAAWEAATAASEVIATGRLNGLWLLLEAAPSVAAPAALALLIHQDRRARWLLPI